MSKVPQLIELKSKKVHIRAALAKNQQNVQILSDSENEMSPEKQMMQS